MTIFLFIAVLFFLILVHELGHFVTAKWSKMRVDEFAIGFPPRLFTIKKGETDYSINLLPIGGYVKIFGENGLEETERARAFGSRPRYQQAIVLLAGIAMNILTAWIIFFAVSIMGTPTIVDEYGPMTETAELAVINVLPDSPAAAANIPLGAQIVDLTSSDEVLLSPTPTTFNDFIAAHADRGIEINYVHKEEVFRATLTPRAGVIDAEPDRKAVGLATALVTVHKENLPGALIGATKRTASSLYTITIGLVSFLASAFTLSADVSQVTGPIGIAGMVGDAAEFGFVSLLIFTAFISLNLAVINLLPIPALDGGRLLFVIAEAIIRRPIDPEWMARVNFAGFVLLIGLMIAVTYNDILRLF